MMKLLLTEFLIIILIAFYGCNSNSNTQKAIGRILYSNGEEIDSLALGKELYGLINEKYEANLSKGYDIITSIDKDRNEFVNKVLLEKLKEQEAEFGSVILLNIKTGEIEAISNIRNIGSTFNTVNYALNYEFEPGSLFKIFPLMIIMDEFGIELDDSFYGWDAMSDKSKNILVNNSYTKMYTTQEIFEYSLNHGMISIVESYYKTNTNKLIDGFDKLNINFDKSLKTRLIEDDESLKKLSIGYGVKMSPMQILSYYNSVANGGKLINPKFVKEIKNRNKHIDSIKTEIQLKEICTENSLDKIQKLLKGVVENGTAKNISNNSYSISGKTGTSECLIDNNRVYNSTFVGYFPSDNPTYSCIVLMHNPKKDIYGSTVAAPVFKSISDYIMGY